jgi:hypothetical protein
MEKKVMRHFALEHDPSPRPAGKTCLLGGVLLLFWITGCGTSSTTPPASAPGPQTYFAPFVAGAPVADPETYTIDDSINTFSQTTYQVQPPVGPQVISSGSFAKSSRRLLSQGTTANYLNTGVITTPPTISTPPPGGFAVELAGQAGGLVQLFGQPVTPLVAAMQCPNFTAAQHYQFITIPAALTDPSVVPQPALTWDSKTNTAYGSVDIISSGSMVTFNNITQSLLPSVGGSGVPAQPGPASIVGACAPTFFGNTISMPGQSIITNPIPGSGASPQATIGIGPTGLLVEDNGGEMALGAGTGAIGLPKPSNPLDTTTAGTLLGGQYLGFVYGAGVFANAAVGTGWSSHLVSFGSSTMPSSCASIITSTATIYGGDFTNDDPSTSSNGFGNSNLAIDLGAQDPANNGLFPKATVCLGGNYAANTAKKTYTFQAVAIAGQLNGKYAIFLIGMDSTQPWAIYLLQSN